MASGADGLPSFNSYVLCNSMDYIEGVPICGESRQSYLFNETGGIVEVEVCPGLRAVMSPEKEKWTGDVMSCHGEYKRLNNCIQTTILPLNSSNVIVFISDCIPLRRGIAEYTKYTPSIFSVYIVYKYTAV